jgi:hypothetical protein
VSGRRSSQQFVFSVSAANGAAAISAIYTVVTATASGMGSCFVAYDADTTTLRLADDAGTSWSSALALGGPGTIANSQCAIHGEGSSVSADGNTLTLIIDVTFDAGFAGVKSIYGLAFDRDGGSSGWQSLGSLTIGAHGMW